MIRWFWDDDASAFFDTASDAEKLITRPRDITDNAMPSGTSLAAELLLHLGDLTGDAEMRSRAVQVVEGAAVAMTRYPSAFGHLLGAAGRGDDPGGLGAHAQHAPAARGQDLEVEVIETADPE